MKPEWCTQGIWDEARKIAISLNGFAQPDDFSRIARALIQAHQRGRREGMEESAKECERLLVFADTTSDADKAIPAAIRAKMEEQP